MEYNVMKVSTLMISKAVLSLTLSLLMLQNHIGFAQEASREVQFKECLVIGRTGQSGRTPLHTDAVEAQIVSGRWTAPKTGDKIALPDGSEIEWSACEANDQGEFRDRAFRGGYAYVRHESDSDRVMLLDASGHNMVYVNGVPRTGDRYSTGMTLLPVQLQKGENHFLFQCSRGRLKAKLIAPPGPVMLNQRDNTLPDLVVGETVDVWGALMAVNASSDTLENLAVWTSGDRLEPAITPVPVIQPLSVRKIAFHLRGPIVTKEGKIEAVVKLVRQEKDSFTIVDETTISLDVRLPDQSHKRTFISDIDGSVQYYAVQPAPGWRNRDDKPALFLSVHGASVEAIGQANAYSAKSWGHIVAPTNRRPYGFDWEDWGRLDAMEVLGLAERFYDTDPQRTYLTGHSMGGHGTWHLGVLFPDRFAAIGPSAGWISFSSYTETGETGQSSPVDSMLKRAAVTSDTLSHSRNYLHEGVYILHGGADDNVPVSQARQMKEHLAAFHHDFDIYEQPGAGHWWDSSDEPGADCVDWAFLFDFFARHRVPNNDEIRTVEFCTSNPGVSSRCNWLEIYSQIHALQISSATVGFDPGKRRFVGQTDNVACLALDLKHLTNDEPLSVELDGESIGPVAWKRSNPKIYLMKTDGYWVVTKKPDASLKDPNRYGPFKEAFQNRMVFVFGTNGTDEENAWALAKARYDAEEFWYRGNGSLDVVADSAFDPEKDTNRSLVLYGNADSNSVWKALLGKNPVQVLNGEVRVGKSQLYGGDLACLFVQPRPGSDRASIAVVSGSGIVGMRLCDRIPYFVSGVGYPDCLVMGPEVLERESEGVRAAGFFGLDWSVDGGEFVWNTD